MGTNVVSGSAKAVVVATGPGTYLGTLARHLVGKRAETSFDRGVNGVSWLLIRFTLVMVPLVFVINGLTKGSWVAAFFFALSVAVGRPRRWQVGDIGRFMLCIGPISSLFDLATFALLWYVFGANAADRQSLFQLSVGLVR